jgi:hypothetical protein
MCRGVEQLHFVRSKPGRQGGGWGRSRTRSRGCGREGKNMKFTVSGKEGCIGCLGCYWAATYVVPELKRWRISVGWGWWRIS